MPELQLTEVLFLLGALFVFSLLTYKRNALDLEGILIGNILGIIVFLFGGFSAFYVLVAFFIIGEITTQVVRRKKKRHETRTTGNILGNGFAAMGMLAIGSVFGFYAAIAAAMADTLSSEIGITSKKKPVLITTFKEVAIGTNGAISRRGLIAAFVGAAIIALMHYFQFQSIIQMPIIIAAGVMGSLADSVLGATLERKGKLNNTWVNFLGSLTGALIGLSAASVLL